MGASGSGLTYIYPRRRKRLTPLGGQGYPVAINDSGQIPVSSPGFEVAGINGSGELAGVYSGGGQQPIAATNVNGAISIIPILGTTGAAFGINDAGQVVGQMTVPDAATGNSFSHAFLWCVDPSASCRALSSPRQVNNRGRIVGGSDGGLLGPPYLPVGSAMDLGTLGGNLSAGTRINNNGEIVGWSSINTWDLGVERHDFVYQNGQMTDLTALIQATGGITITNSRPAWNDSRPDPRGRLRRWTKPRFPPDPPGRPRADHAGPLDPRPRGPGQPPAAVAKSSSRREGEVRCSGGS